MTIKDINDIINAVCPNDEDYEKPCISPKYLRQELEQLALEQEQKYLEQEPTTKNDLAHNLCDSCTNIGCEFQSGIVRTNCAFYMPPHIEPDNCGNYVVQEPTTKNDLGVDCISRTEVLKLMQDNWHSYNGDWAMQESMDDIRALPPVTPQEPILDKIRAEIDKIYEREGNSVDCLNALDELKWFIDKHKAES